MWALAESKQVMSAGFLISDNLVAFELPAFFNRAGKLATLSEVDVICAVSAVPSVAESFQVHVALLSDNAGLKFQAASAPILSFSPASTQQTGGVVIFNFVVNPAWNPNQGDLAEVSKFVAPDIASIPVRFVLRAGGAVASVYISLSDAFTDALKDSFSAGNYPSFKMLANRINLILDFQNSWATFRVTSSAIFLASGVWQCKKPDESLVTCEIPDKCGRDYPGNVVCVSDGLVRPDEDACAFTTASKPAAATPDFSGCPALDLKLTVVLTYDANDDKCVVAYTPDTSMGKAKPDISLTLTPSAANVINWSNIAEENCSGCVYNSGSGTLSLTLSQVSAAAQVRVPCALANRFFRGATVTASATLKTDPLEDVIPAGSTQNVVTLPDNNSVASDTCTLTADFAKADTNASSGRFIFGAVCDKIISTVANPYASVLATLPPGWTFGSTCSVYDMAAAQAATLWLPSATPRDATVSSGRIVKNQPGASADLVGVYFVCNGVTPSATATSSGKIEFVLLTANDQAGVVLSGNVLSYDSAAVNANLDADVLYEITMFGLPNVGAFKSTVSPFVSRLTVGTGNAVFNGQVRLSGTDRAWASVLASARSSVVLRTLMSTSGSTATSVIASKGYLGSYVCSADGSTSIACELAPPSGCSDTLKDPVYCAVGATYLIAANGKRECGFETMPSIEGNYASCAPKIAEFEVAVTDTQMTVKLTADDSAQFIGEPTITLILTQSQISEIVWPTDEECSSVTCAIHTDGVSLSVSIDSVMGDITFMLPVRFPFVTSGATVSFAAQAGGADAVKSGARTQFPLGTHNKYNLAVPLAVKFAADTDNGRVGTLVLSALDPATTLVPADKNVPAFEAVTVSLPAGWSLGSQCLFSRNSKVMGGADAWPLTANYTTAESDTETGAVTILSTSSLGELVGFTLICTGVTANDGATTAGSVNIVFTGQSNSFVATYPTAATVTYDSTNALPFKRYVAIRAKGPQAGLTQSQLADVSAQISGDSDFQTFFNVKTVADSGVDYVVYVGYTGGMRALEDIFLSTQVSMNAFSSVTEGGAWALATSPSPSASTDGNFLCLANDQSYLQCVIGPDATCGDEFLSSPLCVVNGTPVSNGCPFEDAPTPIPVNSGCVADINDLSVVYNSTSLTVSFTKVAKSFLSRPSVVFILETSRPNVFDWSRPNICIESVMCVLNNDGSLTVMMGTVDATPALGSVTIWSPADKFGFAWDTIKVRSFTTNDVERLPGEKAPGVPLPSSFPIGSDVGMISTNAATVITASFQSLAAPWLDGTLAITATIGYGSKIVPSASFAPASLVAKLPAGWTMGSSCSVFFVTQYVNNTWFYQKEHVSAEGVTNTDDGSVIVVPSPAGSDAFRSISLKCSVTSPSTATVDAPLFFGIANAASAAFARPATLPKLQYDPATASDAPRVVTFTINTLPNHNMNLARIVSSYTGISTDESIKVSAIQRDAATVSVLIRMTGNSLVYLPLLTGTHLLKDTLYWDNQASLDEDTIEETLEGEWKCKGTSGLPEICVLTPAGCSDRFQSAPSCFVAADENPNACFYVTPPTPGVSTSSCAPAVSSFTASYYDDTDTVTISIVAADESQFLAKPTIDFVLTQNARAAISWGVDTVCEEGLVCSFDVATGGLKVTVDQVGGDITFTVPAPTVRFDETPSITLGASIGGVSVFTGASVTQPLSPIRVQEFTLEMFHSVVTTSPASFVLSIGDGNERITSPRFSQKLASIGIETQGANSLSGTCVVRVRSSGDSAWPLALPAYAATQSGNTLTGDWQFGPSTFSVMYIQCDGGSPTADLLTGLTVAFIGDGESYLLKLTPSIESSSASITDTVGRRVVLNMSITPDTQSPPSASSIAAAALKSVSGIKIAPFSQDGSAVQGLLGFSDGSRAWFSLFKDLSKLIPALVSDFISIESVVITLNNVEGNPAFELQGVWECSTGGASFGECTAPNKCGSLVGTPVCRRDNITVDSAICWFVAQPASLVTSGCGAWKCKHLNTFVDCNDARVCEDGCKANVAVTVLTEMEQHLDPDFKNGRFRQYCVVDGNSVDIPTFCPSGLVSSPAPYAATCDAKSLCGLWCSGADGKAKLCDSELSWGACSASCGEGTQARYTYCSGEGLPIGATVAGSAAVDRSFCPEFTYFAQSRSCYGAACTQYAWKCATTGGTPSDCTDSSYGSCSATCGAGTQTRTVTCVAYAADGTIVAGAAPESLCAARAAKPVSTRNCASSACSTATWKCYPVGGNPFLVSDCSSNSAFKCAASGCRAAVSARRNVACYDGTARAAASKCDLEAKPVATVDCAAVHEGCYVDFTGATCSILREDAVTTQCVASAGAKSGVYRRGVCRNSNGEHVAGACTTAVTDEECTFPVCNAATTYTWSTDSSAACVPGCKSYQPTPSVCLAAVDDEEPLIVDDSFCAGAGAKPAPYADCVSGATPCANSGVCTAQSVVVGSLPLGNVWGTCVCPVGYGGPTCSLGSTLSDVAVYADSNYIEWQFADRSPDASPFIMVYISSATSPSNASGGAFAFSALSDPITDGDERLVAIVPSDFNYDSSSEISRADIDLSYLAPGPYTMKLTTAGNREYDMPFQAPPACSASGCLNGGTCNTETGMCECVGDFSGAQCGVAPCDTLACNALTSSCDLTTNSKAMCICNDGFSGDRCNALAVSCPLDASEGACVHGARNVFISGSTPSCGACECEDGWSGALCDTCALSCQNGGTVASDICGVCSCPAGHHGDLCEFRHTIVTLNFKPAAADVATETKVAVWTRVLQMSLNALVRVSIAPLDVFSVTQAGDGIAGELAVPVVVLSVTDAEDGLTGTVYKQVKARVGAYGSSLSSEQHTTYSAVASLKTHFGGSTATTISRSASSLPTFSSLYLARGVGASDPNCTDDDDTECPTGSLNGGRLPTAEETDEGSSSGLSRGGKIALGVCLGVGGAIILAILITCVLRKPGAKAKSADKSVEMMTTATYDV
jgi:hypothetical protein